MKRISVVALTILALMLGAVMVQAQETTTPEPTIEPTAQATTEPTTEPVDEPTAEVTETEEEEVLPAWVRFVNWTGDSATVDVYVNGAVEVANLAPLTETGYQSYAAGFYSFAAVAAGASTEGATTVFDLVLAEGGHYTVAAVGSTAAGTSIAVLSIDDDSPIRFGSARLYVYHAVEGAGNVDLFANDQMVITELGYPGTFIDLNGAINDGAFAVDLPAGTYNFSVRATENSAVTGLNTTDETEGDTTDTTTDDAAGETEDVPALVELNGVVIEPGVIYTIAVVQGAEGLQAYVSSMAGVAEEQASALDVALSSPDFSILVAAVKAADPAILDALSADGTLTVFAPTNAAFDAFLNSMAMTTDDLFANTDLLNSVLLYHVLGTSMTAADLGSRSGETVAALQGELINVLIDEAGTITLNDNVYVTRADIAVSNGYVHVIDGVLVPPSIAGQ